MFTKKLFLKLFAALFAILLFLSACNGGNELHFTAFKNTHVIVQARDKVPSDFAAESIRKLLYDLDAEFSATKETSTVYKINAATAGKKTEISEKFRQIANECVNLWEFTEGKFDISVYPLTLLWQFAPKYPVYNFAVPLNDEINEIKSLIGLNKFSFENYAVKSENGAKIDFGGALKGYAADEIAKILKADGVKSGYVNVGGSSINLISVDKLYVRHPREDDYILSVNIKEKDLSVSTSGDYEKTYTAQGKTYSHIINPESGYPSDGGVASMTIIGKNGLRLDALTTAACVFSHDFKVPKNGELYRFIKKILDSEDYSDAQIYAVCVNGENKQVLTNKKQGEDFTLLDKDYEIIYMGDL